MNLHTNHSNVVLRIDNKINKIGETLEPVELDSDSCPRSQQLIHFNHKPACSLQCKPCQSGTVVRVHACAYNEIYGSPNWKVHNIKYCANKAPLPSFEPLTGKGCTKGVYVVLSSQSPSPHVIASGHFPGPLQCCSVLRQERLHFHWPIYHLGAGVPVSEPVFESSTAERTLTTTHEYVQSQYFMSASALQGQLMQLKIYMLGTLPGTE